MRKLAVTGAVAAAMLTAATGAHAATATYTINGNMSKAVNSCFNIAVSLTNTDCSYARTRVPASSEPSGPKFTAGFYARNSIGDNVGYVPVPNDGKVALAVSGTVTIDDNNTADPADDLIGGTWEIAGGVHNAATGNGDRAVERWSKWTHVMAPTPVNAATVVGAGVEYVIGSRKADVGGNVQTGKPTPLPLCSSANPTADDSAGPDPDCIATESAPGTQDPAGYWDESFAGLPNPASNRIGIERSPGFGLFPPTRPDLGPSPSPNVGAQTTGSFEGYECIDVVGDNDCITSEILLGSSQLNYRTESGTLITPVSGTFPGLGNCQDGIDNGDGDGLTDVADPQCTPVAPTQPTTPPPGGPVLVSPPGLENVILVLTTDDALGTLSAQAFWTREYIIASGPAIGSDTTGNYNINNSYGSGRIVFTGALPQDAPTARDDTQAVIQDTATVVNVLANDDLGAPAPNVISIDVDPAHGTISPIQPTDTAVTYTPDLFYFGSDTFTYRVTDGDDQSSTATVTLNVSNKAPTAGNFTASSRNGNASAAIPVLVTPTVLGTGPASGHTVSVAGAATLGSCVADNAAKTVQFIPTAGGGDGAGSCEFQIADVDGQTDSGTLTVSVSGNGGGGGGGGGGPQLPSGGSSLDLVSLGALLAGLPLLARRRRATR